MKKTLTLFLILTGISVVSHAQISIASARTMPLGSTVTVKGIALNGTELGSIRYLQDATGNIAAYSSSLFASVQRGDTVLITGPLDDYNGLLEISPASSATIINSGNPLPAPAIITCTSGFIENYEAHLVTVDNATFTATGTFSTSGSGTNYDITDATGTAQVREVTTTNIDGTPIPVGPGNITGIMSQYAPSGTGGYQLLPRDLTDIAPPGNPPIISTPLTETNITTSSFTVNFQTVNPGNTIIYYGLTSSLGATVSDPSLVTSHATNLTGLAAGTIYYVKGASVSATNDTSFSALTVMATASTSTGQIKIWFNNPVDNSVATGTLAEYLDNTLDDSIKYFMDHAKYSLDVCIYNLDNLNNIITSINDAYARGVNVRVICDNGVSDANYNSINVGSGNKKKSPVDGSSTPTGNTYGICHDKFLIVDEISANPDDPWVVTGSANYTDEQIKTDRNNVIAVQDQSLAKGYELEFNEMFGGKFGPDKTDNTPHQYIIGGKQIESYFSPTDGTESELISHINTVNYDLYFCIYSFTRSSIAYAIQDAVDNRGVFGAGIYDQTDASDSTPIYVCENALGDHFFHYTGSGLLHHKYLIGDPNCPNSDPFVFTGSHNWSSSADGHNDENVLIVHDSTVANIYYQEFVQRYKDEGGNEFVGAKCDFLATNDIQPSGDDLSIYPNPARNYVTIQISASQPENATLNIFDISGRLMQTQKMVCGAGEVNYTLDITGLPAGMYVADVVSSDSLKSTRFVVLK